MSDRITPLPGLADSAGRQIVLLITSDQSLERDDGEGIPVTKRKRCTEYLVIQKLRLAGEEKEWRIWGHTEPVTVEDLNSPIFNPDTSLSERLMAVKESFGTQ